MMMCSIQTSALTSCGAMMRYSTTAREQEDYHFVTLRQSDRWVGSTHHANALEIRIDCAKVAAATAATSSNHHDSTKWTSDLLKLQSDCHKLLSSSQQDVSSLTIRQQCHYAGNGFQAPEIPVQFLVALCRNTRGNLQHLECDFNISGTKEEFQQWAMALKQNSSLTHMMLRHPYGTSTEESCEKWEPVISALLSPKSSAIQELRVDWNGKQADGSIFFGPKTSSLILEHMERNPKKISINFPLSFNSMEEASRYYKISRMSNAVFQCTSPMKPDSFMGRFFQQHKFPVLPEACIHVTGRRKKDAASTTTIAVRVSKRELADPTILTFQIQKMLGSTVKVTPPVIHKLELFLDPNYLKSRYIYSQFPEHLWDVDVVSDGAVMEVYSPTYQDMVSILQEGRILGNTESLTALFEWFVAYPNNLLQLNYC